MDGIISTQNPETVTRTWSIRLFFLILALLLHAAAFSKLVGFVVWPAPPLEKTDFGAVPLRAGWAAAPVPPMPPPDVNFTPDVAFVPGIPNVASPTLHFQAGVPNYLFETKPKPLELEPDGRNGFAVPNSAREYVPLPFVHETPPNLFREGRGGTFLMSPVAGGEIVRGHVRVGDLRKTQPRPGPTD